MLETGEGPLNLAILQVRQDIEEQVALLQV